MCDNLLEIVEKYGNNSRKIICNYYIDDRAMLPESVCEAAPWQNGSDARADAKIKIDPSRRSSPVVSFLCVKIFFPVLSLSNKTLWGVQIAHFSDPFLEIICDIFR